MRPRWSLASALSVVFLLAASLLAGPAGQALAATPSTFAAVSSPVSVATVANGLLVTQINKDKILFINQAGASSTFAILPSTGGAQVERYLAISPGLGGFPLGYIYVTVQQKVYQVTPDGQTVTLFATVPNLPNSNNFVVFDRIGSFGYKMIIVGGQRSTVYTVDSTGTSTLIADLSATTSEIEGADVAPSSFIPYAGDLITASKFDSTVYAIAPDGTFQTVGTWPNVEQALFVPGAVCNLGTTGGAFFVAIEGQNVIKKFPATDLASLAGTPSAMVTDETTTTIGVFTSDGTNVISSSFNTTMGAGDLEESAFATCPPVPSIATFTPTSGPVGTPVTVTGSGFLGATAVAFNGVSATYQVSSDTSISAIVPAGATTGPITVTNASGTATSAPSFTVTTVAASCIPSWRVATMPTNTTTNALAGATAPGETDVWAVGNTKTGSVTQTLTEHLTGTVWNIVASPNAGGSSSLAAVSAVSPTDVWAVGNSKSGVTTSTLAMHWDGTSWIIVATPNLGTVSALSGVAAIATNDVWAVGYSRTGTVNQTLTMHYDGTSWTVVSSANLGTSDSLAGVSAAATNDVWAVGTFDGASLIEHWDGAAWSTVASPSAGTLLGVGAVSGTDVWAVGTNAGQNVAQHWNGAAWSIITTPNPGTVNSLGSVAATTSNDVWAVGTITSSGIQRSLIEHWDGTAWTSVSTPALGSLAAVAARASGLVWTAGTYPATGIGLSLVEQLCEESVTDAGFSPQNAAINQGETVAWRFPTTNTISHSVTDASGMALVDSGLRGPGSSFTFTFFGAAIYTLSDTASSHRGKVTVPLLVTPSSGDMSTVFTLTWSSQVAPSPFVFDVQIKRPGDTKFNDWIQNLTSTGTTFTADGGPGTYSWHARVRNSSTSKVSGFSQSVSVTVSQPQPAPTITSFSPGTGSPGTPVSITGTTFTGTTAVKFNGVASTSFTVNSDTAITANVPVGSSTGPISVTTPGGTATTATTFTVLNGVSAFDFGFTPTPITVAQGGGVLWSNAGPSIHDTNSDGCVDGVGTTGVGLWCSPDMNVGDTFSFVFTAAGQFTYHCSIHPVMVATVSVLPTASPASGPVGTTFTITVATVAPDTDLVYDIQKKDPGRQFQDWMIGITTPSATFVPAAAGTYQFRARVRRISTNGASLYSSPVSITVSA
jgi:plastocyanin